MRRIPHAAMRFARATFMIRSANGGTFTGDVAVVQVKSSRPVYGLGATTFTVDSLLPRGRSAANSKKNSASERMRHSRARILTQ